MARTLGYLLKRRKSKASAADMEKFVAEHSREKFRSDLLKFFSFTLPKLKSFSRYNVRSFLLYYNFTSMT